MRGKLTRAARAVQRVCIVANPKVSESYSKRLVSTLDKHEVKVEKVSEPTWTLDDGDPDLIFVLGGDGTMLRASKMYPGQVLIGLNLGTVGFMSGILAEELESGVEKVLKGEIHVQEYRMLEVQIAGQDAVRTAVNDAVLVKKQPHHVTSVEVVVDGEGLATLRCDGFVAATPLGSTAYALSAGGPIVAGNVECYVLVPIAPHSLLTRPLILGRDQSAELRVGEPGALLSLDGGDPEEIPDGGYARLGLGSRSVKVGRTDEWSWWRAVRNTFLQRGTASW